MLEVNECDRGKQCKAEAFFSAHFFQRRPSSLPVYAVLTFSTRKLDTDTEDTIFFFPVVVLRCNTVWRKQKPHLVELWVVYIRWAFTPLLYLQDLEGREGQDPPENSTETQYQITADIRTLSKRSGKEKEGKKKKTTLLYCTSFLT